MAVPFVIEPNLSITLGLAAAGISSIAFNEPFDCQSSFFNVPVDFRTLYDCATNCAGTEISKTRFSDFNGIMGLSFSTISLI